MGASFAQGATASKPGKKTAEVKKSVRTTASTETTATPQVRTRVRSISGIRHLNAAFLAAQQGIGALTSISFGWGPRLFRSEGDFFEVRANLGVALLKRISPSALFLTPELWLLASLRVSDKIRFEAGPLVQYWMTTDQGINFGATVQLVYEVKWISYFDRLFVTYQPVFNKVELAHFFRIGMGFSF